MSNQVLAEARIAVDRLLEQYQQYLAMQRQLQDQKTQLTRLALEMARATGRPFPTLLTELPGRLGRANQDIRQREAQLQAISDAMTFANPVVWMQYKYEAYAGTSQAIADMQDFRKHCSKPGYICTKRFEFVNSWLRRTGADMHDAAAFPDTMRLDDVYTGQRLVRLCRDTQFMQQWDSHEYHRSAAGTAAKWENYYPNPK